MNNYTSNRRFTPKTIRLSLWQSICFLVCDRRWIRETIVFKEVNRDDPGYEDAPYGESVTFHKEVFHIKLDK